MAKKWEKAKLAKAWQLNPDGSRIELPVLQYGASSFAVGEIPAGYTTAVARTYREVQGPPKPLPPPPVPWYERRVPIEWIVIVICILILIAWRSKSEFWP